MGLLFGCCFLLEVILFYCLVVICVFAGGFGDFGFMLAVWYCVVYSSEFGL